jgi:hypothetical protein
MIMTLNRRVTVSAFAALGLAAALATFSMSNGDASYVGNCIYSDYQQCLVAAAESRGNCVQNIDYRGEPAAAPMARRSRAR